MYPRTLVWLLVFGAASAAAAAPAAAQLRPIEPFEWQLYDRDIVAAVEAGGAVFADQRAALAGEIGTLYELASFRAFWRTGRVVLEAAGTPLRVFRAHTAYQPPDVYVEPAADGRRHDSGDYLVISTVRLTPADAPLLGVLRFGTRLPTTNNRTGLERDMTDFFALAGGRVRRNALLVAAEAGVSINGTRDPEFEQKDVLVYAMTAQYERGPVVPYIGVTGDVLGPRHRRLRGNEPLGEARLGVRTAGRRWLRIEAVAGYRSYSPSSGLRISAGTRW
jgi:hypothetical protein